MEFDKKKFLQLLKEREKFFEKGQLSNFDADKDKASRLSRYLVLIESQIYWEDRYKYFQILESFAKSKITHNKFVDQFDKLVRSNRQTYLMLKERFKHESSGILSKSNEIEFKFNPKSIDFGKIISSVESYINICDTRVTLEMNLKKSDSITFGMSPDLFRSIVLKSILPKLKKYCKE